MKPKPQRDGMILLHFECPQCKLPGDYTAERLVIAEHPPQCMRCDEYMVFEGAKRLKSKGDWVWLTRHRKWGKYRHYRCRKCGRCVHDGYVPECYCDKPEEKP